MVIQLKKNIKFIKIQKMELKKQLLKENYMEKVEK